MGVTGLWQVIQPCARPTNLATLNRKRLAVDASIWIYQFLKAMRDKDGNAMYNGHIVGFFRRICRLLFYGVMPVFVFDGGAPMLKRMTIEGRRKRREGRREDAAKTAGKLLAVQMQRLADEEDERRKRRKDLSSKGTEDLMEPRWDNDSGEEAIPDASQLVYVDEIGLDQRERLRNRRFQKQDAYHLPDLPEGIEAMGRPEDPRIMSVEELEEYARQFKSGEDINLYDFSKIDFDGDFFTSLPAVDRYNILNAARLRSRLRMGVSKGQLDGMFPNRMDFSRFQVERVRERNRLTQRLMYEIGIKGTDLTVGVIGRIAGEKDREYVLVKNDGADGGWALGVVSRNKDLGKSHQPINVDALDIQFQKPRDGYDSGEDEEFEDVPIEGVNRLPKPKPHPGSSATDYMTEQARAMGASVHQLYGLTNQEDEPLFVEDASGAVDASFGSQRSRVEDSLFEEEDDLNRAIEMSLQSQNGDSQAPETYPEKGREPTWVQKVVEDPKAIKGPDSGSMIAHIVNNRSRAAVKNPKSKAVKEFEGEDSSDSEIDFGAALAADAKKRKLDPVVVQDQAPATTSGASKGPLPFEAMDWKKSVLAPATDKIAAKKVESSEIASDTTRVGGKGKETAEFELYEEDDEMAGGFFQPKQQPTVESERDRSPDFIDSAGLAQKHEPKPLPPWLTDERDINERLRASRVTDMQQVAENDAYVEHQEALYQKRKQEETIYIESSEEGSDVEVIEVQSVSPMKNGFESTNDTHLHGDVDPAVVPKGPSQQVEMTRTPENGDMVMTEKDIITNDALKPSAIQETEDEDVEFEDVQIPEPDQPQQNLQRERLPGPFKDMQPELPSPETPTNDEDDIFAGIEAPEGVIPDDDVYSDPEDAALIEQLAEEAEAHAQFATSLNYKSNHISAHMSREELTQQISALKKQKQRDQRDADEVNQIMIAEVQSLLRLFGIPYIRAPMEAEAQCAELVRLGLVDGIVTDDSDTFLFGGTRVYKNMFSGNDKYVECYMAADLEKELSLGRNELISLAQLLGSDYVEGLAGIGPVTAVEVLAEFPGDHGLARFKAWWEEVHKTGRLAEEDNNSKFKRKFRKAHGKKLFLPPGFPSSVVQDAYMKPQVDESTEDFFWGVPDLEGLRRFLMGTVGWGPEKTDEVLVPVIKDMNRRAMEGTQSNITRYFGLAPGGAACQGGVADQGAGGEVFTARRRKVGGSKRMEAAVGKLRAAGKDERGASATEADTPAGGNDFKGEEKAGRPKKTRKRKPKKTTRVDSAEDGDEEYQVGGEDRTDDDEDAGVVGDTARRGRGRGKKRAKTART